MTGVFCGYGLATHPHSVIGAGIDECHPDLMSAVRRVASLRSHADLCGKRPLTGMAPHDVAGLHFVLSGMPWIPVSDNHFPVVMRCLGYPVHHRPLWPAEMLTAIDLALAARVPDYLDGVAQRESTRVPISDGSDPVLASDLYETLHQIRELAQECETRAVYVRWSSGPSLSHPRNAPSTSLRHDRYTSQGGGAEVPHPGRTRQ